MSEWFSVQQIDDATYVISENKHWEETHCYLLIGKQRSLLFDTGLGVANIKEVVDSLNDLPVTVVTSHVHWDHIGGHRYFSDIAVHEAETAWLNGAFPLPLSAVKANLLREPCDFPPEFQSAQVQIFQGCPTRILQDDAVFELGGRSVQVIHTPGHSPGHICLYEAERQYLYSGDLIYAGTLYAFYPSTDPLLFHQSVKRVSQLAVRRVFPAHHSLMITKDLIAEIDWAFDSLARTGQLKHGCGCFAFEHFSIKL
ncbi:MAG TPA: MBL fold metallo-hydrolase [Bacillota bacterium]|nr:MBL fold metallo-hydrolase [Bacillota bacterium]